MSAEGYTGAPSAPIPISGVTGLPAALAALTAADAALQGAVDLANWGFTKPSDYGFVGWTFDPVQVQGGSALTPAGTTFVARIRATGPVITNIHQHLTTGGVSLTAGQCFCTLQNDAGAQLGAGAVSGDLSAVWNSGGFKTIPLATPQAVTPGAWYRIRYWYNGTTGPTFSRGVSSSTAIVNAGVTPPAYRYSTADTGITTLASAPNNLGAQTGGAIAHWMGVS